MKIKVKINKNRNQTHKSNILVNLTAISWKTKTENYCRINKDSMR